MAAAKRTLALVSPVPKGEDVRSLQKAVNARMAHFKIDRRVTVDGEYGPQTAHAARQVMVMMGAGPNNRKAAKKLRITRNAQRLIRGRKKTRREKLATVARKPYRRRLRKKYKASPGKTAVAWAVQQLGVTESPPNSNRGPLIDRWSAYWGLTAVPWCGVFCGYAAKKVAGAKVTSWLPYVPSITADARANRNGLRAVPIADARPGDLVCYYFGGNPMGDHVEMVESVSSTSITAIGGNTSSGTAGSQSNGGGVFRRTRPRSQAVCIARPDYR